MVGDGTSSLFWEDHCLDGQTISEIAPNLLLVLGRIRSRRRSWTTWITDIRGAIISPSLAIYPYHGLALDIWLAVFFQDLLQHHFSRWVII
jgi:hypothetical protein